MTRNLALDAVRVTEAAAIGAYAHMGQGDEEAADRAAVAGMSQSLNQLQINGTVCIGEGLKEEADVLYTGQVVGLGDGPEIDVALFPLEGTSIMARGGFNAVSAVAFAESKGLVSMPPVYMDKIAVGSALPDDIISLEATPQENVNSVAEARGLSPADLVVCILDRPRHKDLIENVRLSGARIRRIMDGDLSGAVATVSANSGIDLYMGTGLAPQAVLTAAALRCTGGQFQGRLITRNVHDREKLARANIADTEKIYTVETLVPGDVIFAATGITSGPLLKGIERSPYRSDGYTYTTHSMALRSDTGTWRAMETHHHESGMAQKGT